MISITEAEARDIPVIHGLAHIIWPEAYKDILSSEQLKYMLEKMYSIEVLTSLYHEDGNKFLVARKDNNPVAFALYHPKGSSTSIYRLSKIYVHPDSKGKGIGKMMIENILNNVTPSGASELELNVNRNNPAAGFYKHLGFRISGSEDIDIGGGYFMNDYIMRLPIPAPAPNGNANQ